MDMVSCDADMPLPNVLGSIIGGRVITKIPQKRERGFQYWIAEVSAFGQCRKGISLQIVPAGHGESPSPH